MRHIIGIVSGVIIVAQAAYAVQTSSPAASSKPQRNLIRSSSSQQRDLPRHDMNASQPSSALPQSATAVLAAAGHNARTVSRATDIDAEIMLAQASIEETNAGSSGGSVTVNPPPPAGETPPLEYNAYVDLRKPPPPPETVVEGKEITNEELGRDTVKVKKKADTNPSAAAANGPAKPADAKKSDTALATELKKGVEKEEGFFTKFLAKHQESGPRPEILVKPERAGYKRFYEQGLGFKVTDFLSVSSRVELFEEPIPVESLIFGLYQKAWYTKPWPESNIHLVDKWNKQDAQADVRHSYTRAYAWQAILRLHPALPLLRYTYDRRDLLNYFDPTINGFKLLMQETHEAFAEYAVPFRVPVLGKIVFNPGFQRIRFHGRGNPYASENRDKYLFHFLFKHADNYQTFFGYEYFNGKVQNTPWIMKPNQQHFMVEERIWIPKQKLSIIPGWYYSHQHWRPDPAVFWLHETFCEFNKDFTDKLRATQRTDLRWGQLEHEPDSSVDWQAIVYQPPRIKAQSLKESLKVSYEIIKDIDVSAGVNYSTGLKYTYFDNVGGLWEIELFKPGLIRVRFGYFYNLYYHLQTHAEGFQFRAYMFQ